PANLPVGQGGVPGNPPQNVLMNSGLSGFTVVGTTNQSATAINFTGTESLTLPSNGQARVEASTGTFNALTISPVLAGLGFTAMEFNINAAATGNATVQFFDQFGTAFGGVFSLAGGGQNFFNALASNGEVITRAVINSSVELQAVRQVRVGDVVSFNVVPEPATWAMMILGMGMVGMGLRLRRRSSDPLAV